METNLDTRLMFPFRVHESDIGLFNLSKAMEEI